MSAASKLGRITGAGGSGGGYRRGSYRSHAPYHAMSHAGFGAVGSRAGALAATGRFGGPLLMGALAGGMVMHSGFEKSVEYNKKLSQFQAIGFSPDQMAEVQRLTSQTKPGVSPLRQIEALADAQMATRKFSDAKMLAPSLEKMKFIADAMFTGLSDGQMKSAVRIAEIRGGADPNKIKNELDTVMQMYTTSAGTIKPDEFLAMFRKYSHGKMITREGLLALEPAIQEVKPTTVGVALRTLYNRLHGGVKISNKDAGFFSKIGLFKKGKLVQSYSDMLDKDPEAFYEKVILPLYANQGIKTRAAREQANVHFGTTPSQLFSTLDQNTEKAARAREQGSKLMGLDDLMQTAFKTQSGSALRFMQALESLVVALGKFSSPGTIKVLNAMAFLMERMSKAFGEPGQPDIKTGFKVNNKPIHWGDAWNNFNKSPVVSPNIQNSGKMQGDVHLDGQKVGKVIWKQAADSLNRGGTQSAPSGINPRMTPQPTGLNTFGGST